MEAADLFRLESGGLDVETAFLRHLYKSGVNFAKIKSATFIIAFCDT